MNTITPDLIVKASLRSCALVVCLWVPLPVYAAVDRRASIDASGEGAIFDVRASAAGTLRVGTKAGRVGDRWRVTIVQANVAGAVSAVGSGSSTGFSGFVSKTVTANVQYIVLITWDRPLPGAFPASVTVRFTGPTDATNPPVVQLNGGALANIIPRPIHFVEATPTCPADGSPISCGALLKCQYNPAGDTDAFRVTVPLSAALSINVNGPGSSWRIFAPNGTAVNAGCTGQCEVRLTTSGTYTVLASSIGNQTGEYRLSLLGISTAYRCGPTISPGRTTTGRFDLAGDTDSFLLNGVAAGQTYSISVAGPGAAWKIFAPDGTQIGGSCSGQCQVRLPNGGGYTIKVFSIGNQVGSYTLAVQLVGG